MHFKQPTILQLPVTERCNSRCVMCGIWKQKPSGEKELTPKQYYDIFKNPFFSQITSVGIHGGEPTLRTDLHEVVRALVDALPGLKNSSILTNAINADSVIKKVSACSDIFKKAGINFSVGISIDGFGDSHDKNRGTPGNFTSAEFSLDKLKSLGINVWGGCTFTPENCWYADDVLLWFESKGLSHFEFRVAEKIDRLYNEISETKYSLSDTQRFHLSQFFCKISCRKEESYQKQLFYKNLSQHLSEGASREVPCPWQTDGISLDPYGNISFCSVAGKTFGNLLRDDPQQLVKKNWHLREEVMENRCQACLHDLVAGENVSSWIENKKHFFMTGLKIIRRSIPKYSSLEKTKFTLPLTANPRDWKSVLITGWWGTETAGDKAILAELIHFLKERSPDCRFICSTINRSVSLQTNIELGIAQAELVEIEKCDHPSVISRVDAVIIGGGPLEELYRVLNIESIFQEASRQKKARIIFGCGYGPLYSNNLRNSVNNICRLSTAGFWRDENSLNAAMERNDTVSFSLGCDPALAHIKRWKDQHINISGIHTNTKPDRLITLLRANTNEYVQGLSRAELKGKNDITAGLYAAMISGFWKDHNIDIDLMAMHTLYVGGDDRIFNRQVSASVETYVDSIVIQREYLTLDEHLHRMTTGNLMAIVMRYHGHLFSAALGIPFLSIDYTGKGYKVDCLIKRLDYDKWCLRWDTINPDKGASILKEIAGNFTEVRARLSSSVDNLIKQLNKAYDEQFAGD